MLLGSSLRKLQWPAIFLPTLSYQFPTYLMEGYTTRLAMEDYISANLIIRCVKAIYSYYLNGKLISYSRT